MINYREYHLIEIFLTFLMTRKFHGICKIRWRRNNQMIIEQLQQIITTRTQSNTNLTQIKGEQNRGHHQTVHQFFNKFLTEKTLVTHFQTERNRKLNSFNVNIHLWSIRIYNGPTLRMSHFTNISRYLLNYELRCANSYQLGKHCLL